MTSEESILGQITLLLESGALPRSACSASLIRTLQPLLDAGVLVEQRSGGGRSLVVHDADALQEFSRRHFPNLTVAAELSSRTQGVARFRDSKTFASDTPEIICIRAWSDQALRKQGQPAGAVQATTQHGLFSFLLKEDYSLHGTCALVENPAVFTQIERLHLRIGLAIWSRGGRASTRLVDWLAASAAPDFSLLHLPDYDPVGLLEFTRLRARLGSRVKLHLPEDLAERFARFSTRAILQKHNNRAMLAALRGASLAEVRQVVELIDRNNACLEQEALLL